MSRPVSAIFADLNTRDLVEPLERIAKAHHVTASELLGRSRLTHVTRARWAFLAHLCGELGFSANHAGKMLGLDHSTVLNALRLYAARGGHIPPATTWISGGVSCGPPTGGLLSSCAEQVNTAGFSCGFGASHNRVRPEILVNSVFSPYLNTKKEKAGDTGTSTGERAREFASNPVSEMRLRGAIQDPPGSASILDSLESKRGSAS